MKENEANMLADFLMPMLRWFPDQRASAQEMLKHPWLNMESNYDTKMTELEYRKMQLVSDVYNEGKIDSDPSDVSELGETDNEMNYADVDDNAHGDILATAEDGESEKEDGGGKEESEDWGSRSESGEDELNLNTSFTGGYLPNTNLSRIDKGRNPQFDFDN